MSVRAFVAQAFPHVHTTLSLNPPAEFRHPIHQLVLRTLQPFQEPALDGVVNHQAPVDVDSHSGDLVARHRHHAKAQFIRKKSALVKLAYVHRIHENGVFIWSQTRCVATCESTSTDMQY